MYDAFGSTDETFGRLGTLTGQLADDPDLIANTGWQTQAYQALATLQESSEAISVLAAPDRLLEIDRDLKLAAIATRKFADIYAEAVSLQNHGLINIAVPHAAESGRLVDAAAAKIVALCE